MAFTNETIIRKHLAEFRRPAGVVENLPFRMSGIAFQELPHKGILPGSEKIKGRENVCPTYENMVLGEGPAALGQVQIIAESVVISKDQSLTAVYRENIDYLVDYRLGSITRLEAGAIAVGQNVSVWYFFYRLYALNSDYAIDHASGKIKRLPEGEIQDGQAVWIDYSVENVAFAEEVITRALEEAHAIVSGQISAEYQDSSDSILEVAETYLAIAALCRMHALEVLQSDYVNYSQKSNQGQDYLRLGQSYREEAEKLLLQFRRRSPVLTSPRKMRNEI